MNRKSVGVLIAFNMVLLMALFIVSLGSEPAHAQFRQSEYIMIAGDVQGRTEQGVYIIDVASGRMSVIFFDLGRGTYDVVPAYSMSRDIEQVTSRLQK